MRSDCGRSILNNAVYENFEVDEEVRIRYRGIPLLKYTDRSVGLTAENVDLRIESTIKPTLQLPEHKLRSPSM